MDLAPQLEFRGQCREAFEVYAKLLDGKITVMNTFADNQDHSLPPGSAEGQSDAIRFAEVRFSGGALRGNDIAAEAYRPPAGCTSRSTSRMLQARGACSTAWPRVASSPRH